MGKYEKSVTAFERAALEKGYSFKRDELGRYEDIFLQEAWEIFVLIDYE